MKTSSPLVLLAGAGLAAIAVLAGTGHAVPTILQDVELAVVAGGLGLAVPDSDTATVTGVVANIVKSGHSVLTAVITDLRGDLAKLASALETTAPASSPPVGSPPAPAPITETVPAPPPTVPTVTS